MLSTTFAKEGANVAINYFNRLEPAQQVQKQCQEAGVKAVVIKAVCVLDSSLHRGAFIKQKEQRYARGVNVLVLM